MDSNSIKKLSLQKCYNCSFDQKPPVLCMLCSPLTEDQGVTNSEMQNFTEGNSTYCSVPDHCLRETFSCAHEAELLSNQKEKKQDGWRRQDDSNSHSVVLLRHWELNAELVQWLHTLQASVPSWPALCDHTLWLFGWLWNKEQYIGSSNSGRSIPTI